MSNTILKNSKDCLPCPFTAKAPSQLARNLAGSIQHAVMYIARRPSDFWSTEAYAIAALGGIECARFEGHEPKFEKALLGSIKHAKRVICENTKSGNTLVSETEHAWLKWQVWMGMDEREANVRVAFAKACDSCLYTEDALRPIISKTDLSPEASPSSELILKEQASPTKVMINWSRGRVFASQAGFLKQIGRGLTAPAIKSCLAASKPVRETLMCYALAQSSNSSEPKMASLRNPRTDSSESWEGGAR